ncbi:diguanylate cyclase domain-containing protein [Armatimonas rosea]|uniref:Diguanylate cyclase (GGDEF)-like protein n=1 Tax=Armatimonas rosea TaxID=685828 RepID=A0A7W9W6Y8_ARMRO|nr:diguanylate cyclase (GGDEF)-like protein [Armatimonas rosea]
MPATEVSPSPHLPPVIEEKLRRLTLTLTPLGILVLVISIWQNSQTKHVATEAYFGLPLLLVYFTAIWLLTRFRFLSGQRATLAFTLPICLHLCLEELEHAWAGSLYTDGDPGNFGWTFVMYLLLSLTLERQRARWVSVAFLLVQIAIYLSGLRRFTPTAEVQISFTQHFAASLIAIGVLGLTSDIRQYMGQVQLMAATDSLTGLINRRQMQLHLEEAVATQRGFVLLLLDIDHFKQVNDQHGHNTGDDVLRELSKHLHTCLRPQDLLGRWGGEEFLVLVPDASLDEVHQFAEALLQHTRKRTFPKKLSLTLSIGGAQYVAGERPEDVVHRADMALYQAKQTGRNRFHFHEKAPLADAA